MATPKHPDVALAEVQKLKQSQKQHDGDEGVDYQDYHMASLSPVENNPGFYDSASLTANVANFDSHKRLKSYYLGQDEQFYIMQHSPKTNGHQSNKDKHHAGSDTNTSQPAILQASLPETLPVATVSISSNRDCKG